MRNVKRQIPEMVYHCIACKDIILVEVVGSKAIPEGISCQATLGCKGRMVRYARDNNMPLPPSVYVYQWVNKRITRNNEIMDLIKKPGHPRISRVHLAVRNALQKMTAQQATL